MVFLAKPFVAIALLGLAPCVFAQTSASGGHFLIDPSVLENDDLAYLRRQVLEDSIENAKVSYRKVVEGDSLSSIVLEEYGFGSSKDPSTHRDLIDAIKRTNDLAGNTVLAGTLIKIPDYFKRPYRLGADNSKVQIFSRQLGEIGMAPVASIAERQWNLFGLDKPPESASREGGVIAFHFSPDKPIFIRSESLVKYFGKEIGIAPSSESFLLSIPKIQELDSVSFPAVAPVRLDDSIVKKIEASERKAKIYLLDVFSANGTTCEHGDLVYEKLVQTYRALGTPSLIQHIQKVDINFFAHREKSTKFVEDWVKTHSGNILPEYRRTLQKMKELHTPKDTQFGAVPVPGLFLQAIYGTAIQDPNAFVVSGSFTTSDPSLTFPKDVVAFKKVSLLNAVLNETSVLENDLYIYHEPLRSFYLYRQEVGTILVGYGDSTGAPLGMYSSKGDGVTTLDYGYVIGETGACKGKAAYGASFATPVVAAKLTVAKLVWESNGLSLDSMAARRRILMASMTDTRVLGKYWSAGMPDMQKLTRTTGALGVRKDGTSIDLTNFVGRMFVTVRNKNGDAPISLVFGKGEPDTHVFIAMQLNNGRAYLLNKATQKWSEVNLESVCFCDGKSAKEVMHSEAAHNHFTEVVYYEE